MASVRTRKRGKTFSYIFEVGRDENGKRKVIEKGGFKTKNEAYTAGVEAFNDWKHGNIGITSEKILVADFLRQWLKNVAALAVKDSTFIQYSRRVETHIVPYIGNIVLQELTPLDVDKLLNIHFQRGLAQGSIRTIRLVLHSALSYAVYPAKLIQNNPSEYVKVPKQAAKSVIQRHVIPLETLNELLEEAPFGTNHHIPLLLLYYTGMRIGEVLGLTWDNVDLNNAQISVTQQSATSLHKLSSLKTSGSNRVIPISRDLADTLHRWHDRQQKNKELYAGQYLRTFVTDDGSIKCMSINLGLLPNATPVDFVCTSKHGRMVSYHALRHFLALHGLNTHSFRHTHATLLMEHGATPKGVADRLGHSDIQITQNLYTHVTEKMKNDTLAAFDDAINADKE